MFRGNKVVNGLTQSVDKHQELKSSLESIHASFHMAVHKLSRFLFIFLERERDLHFLFAKCVLICFELITMTGANPALNSHGAALTSKLREPPAP